MKRLLIIAVVGLLSTASLVASAQATNAKGASIGYMLSTPTHGTTDTASNAVSKKQNLEIVGKQDQLTIQSNFTKISGTVGGTATLKGSVDGVGWTTVGTAFTLTDVASQTATFDVGAAKFKLYQLDVTGTGTMAVKFQSPWLIKQPLK